MLCIIKRCLCARQEISRKMRTSEKQLPYINNFLAVAVTALVAMLSVLVHNHGDVSRAAALQDSVWFDLLTFMIDTAIVYPQLKKRYRAGTLPAEPRGSRLLTHAPRNPFLFALLGAVLFIGVTVLFTWVLLPLLPA